MFITRHLATEHLCGAKTCDKDVFLKLMACDNQ